MARVAGLNQMLTVVRNTFLGLLVLFMASQARAVGAGDMANANGAIGVASAVFSGWYGKKMIGECGGSSPDKTKCYMGVLLLMQAGTSALHALNSFQTEKQINDGGAPPPDFDLGNQGWTDSSGKPESYVKADWGEFKSDEGFQKEVKAGLDQLAAQGYSFDAASQTISGPGGKKVPVGALSSGKAMADAGLIGSSDIAAYDAGIKKYQDKIKSIAMGIGGGGGGGSSSTSSSKAYSYNDPFADFLKSRMQGPNKPKTSGLTRALASGESIGTQTDNIFQMIRRRYEQKKHEYVFVP